MPTRKMIMVEHILKLMPIILKKMDCEILRGRGQYVKAQQTKRAPVAPILAER